MEEPHQLDTNTNIEFQTRQDELTDKFHRQCIQLDEKRDELSHERVKTENELVEYSQAALYFMKQCDANSADILQLVARITDYEQDQLSSRINRSLHEIDDEEDEIRNHYRKQFHDLEDDYRLERSTICP